jgi:hypothetical protein
MIIAELHPFKRLRVEDRPLLAWASEGDQTRKQRVGVERSAAREMHAPQRELTCT